MNKRYYWLKLKNDFFKDKRIKKLRKIAGGDTYTIIYLKMQLLSLQDEGILYYDGVEDTFEEEIALQIDEDVEDVKITIGFLLRHQLLVQDESNEYQLPETINSIGSETASTIRSRKSREKQKVLQCNNNATKCNIEIEIDKDIDIDKKENNKRKSYGEYKRVKLTDKEYQKLIDDYGKERIDKQIQEMDKYVESNNNKNKYSNFNLVLRKSIRENWFKGNIKEEPEWFYKNLDKEDTTLEEQEELDNILKEMESE